MSGLFGPQTANAVTTKPNNTSIQRYGGVQTWFKDCSGPGASDGTVPNAAFYNRIVGALDYICGASGVSGLAGDDSLLYRAILQMVSQDAPDALNSLRELANAIADDPNFAGTIMSMLANRLRFDQAQFLNSTQKAQALANLGLVLATVATSGAYADLTGKPTLATVATSGAYADLSGKPSLATVATTGAYADLSGKPTLGTAAALNVGTGASQVVQLDASSKLPAVDGSQLTNLPGAAGLTRVSNALTADVNLTDNALHDGPSIAAGTGTWLFMGYVTLLDATGAATFNVQMWDGTTVIASTVATTNAANGTVEVALQGFITNPAANVRISVADSNGTPNGRIKFNFSGKNKDSQISGLKVA